MKRIIRHINLTLASKVPCGFLFGLAMALTFSSSLLAQGGWTDTGGEIEDAEIIIEKDKNIVLPKAVRSFEKVPPLPERKPLRPVEYNFSGIEIPLSLYPPSLRPLKIQKEPLSRLYGNYLKLGMGNYISPLAELYIHNKRSETMDIGVKARHFSSMTGPVDGQNSGESENSIRVKGSTYGNGLQLSSQVGYRRNGLHFYGYETGEIPEKEDIAQTINRFDVSAALNNTEEMRVNFEAGAAFRLANEAFYGLSEHQVRINTQFSDEISETLKWNFEAFGLISGRNLPEAPARNLLQVRPSLRYHFNDNLSLKGGLNMFFLNDTLSSSENVQVFPELELEYFPVDFLRMETGLTGYVDPVTQWDLWAENPFLGPSIPLAHTSYQGRFYTNIFGRIAGKASFKAGFAYSSVQNLYYFINSPEDISRFDLVYDMGQARLLELNGELNVNVNEKVRSGLKVEYFQYQTVQVAAPWHRPEYIVTQTNNININKKIIFNADLYLMGGLQAFDPSAEQAISLDDIIDLRLKMDYRFSKRLSFWLNAENLLSREYQRYYRYPARQILVLGGFSYAF